MNTSRKGNYLFFRLCLDPRLRSNSGFRLRLFSLTFCGAEDKAEGYGNELAVILPREKNLPRLIEVAASSARGNKGQLMGTYGLFIYLFFDERIQRNTGNHEKYPKNSCEL